MTEKEKMLVGIIAEMQGEANRRDDELEELYESSWISENSAKELKAELRTAREAHHIKVVDLESTLKERDARIEELEEKNNALDIDIKSAWANAAHYKKQYSDFLKSYKRLKEEPHQLKLKMRRLRDMLKRSKELNAPFVLRIFDANERKRSVK